MQKQRVNVEQIDAADREVEPVDVPEVTQILTTTALRELGLPWACTSGEVLSDVPVGKDDDDGVEYRFVTFTDCGQTYGVHYERPLGAPVTARDFDPWPREDTVDATVYQTDGDMLVQADPENLMRAA